MSKILINDVKIITKEGSQVVKIGIDNDKIAFISTEMQADFVADTIIDGKNRLATPGFVNTHTHAAMTLLRSYADDMKLMDWLQKLIWPAEAKLNNDDIYWGSMLAIAEMIRSGTTTFADMYFFMNDVAKAVEETGIRAVLARGLTGDDNSDGKSLKENEEFYQNWHSKANGRITVMFGPHAPYTCSRNFLEKVIDSASKLDAHIHIHLAETTGEVDTCVEKHGKTPISYMNEIGLFNRPTLAAHCVFVNDEDIAIMKEKNVRVAHNPQSNLKLASGVAPIGKMLKQGLTIGLGTDGASSNNNLDLLEELRLVALLHKGVTYDPLLITAQEAFAMATVDGAKAVGLKNCGVLEVGAKADILLFDISKPHWQPQFNLLPLLVYSAQASDVVTVLVNGKILMQDYKLTTIDEERVNYEVNKCVKKFDN